MHLIYHTIGANGPRNKLHLEARWVPRDEIILVEAMQVLRTDPTRHGWDMIDVRLRRHGLHRGVRILRRKFQGSMLLPYFLQVPHLLCTNPEPFSKHFQTSRPREPRTIWLIIDEIALCKTLRRIRILVDLALRSFLLPSLFDCPPSWKVRADGKRARVASGGLMEPRRQRCRVVSYQGT